MSIKILFVWPGLTGYIGDCWRELARHEGIDLKIVVDLDYKYFGGGFNVDEVLAGLDWHADLEAIVNTSWRPNVVFSVGWHDKMCRAAGLMDWGCAKKVLFLDMPWEWRLRKFAARFVLWQYLRRFDAAFVNGRCAATYARWLGFKSHCIYAGSIATNIRRFKSKVGGAGFLYVGRDALGKGVDVLRAAYTMYKIRGGQLQLKIVSGVSPNVLADAYAKADCFVLASRWEHWGVVLVEAADAGLPIICTDKCGVRYEVVRDNGVVVKSGDVESLANAMCEIDGMTADERVAMGAKGRTLAQPYSCEAWADRVIELCGDILRTRHVT